MSQSVEIRRLGQEDAQALWRLRLAALETEPTAFSESVEEHLQTTAEHYAIRLRDGAEDSVVFGAWEGGELVGMVGFYRELPLKRRHRGGIWGMFVLAAWRGKGIGKALLSAALEHARSLPGLTRIHLSVAMTRPEARALYRSLGFQAYGVEPDALRAEGESVDEEHLVLLTGDQRASRSTG